MYGLTSGTYECAVSDTCRVRTLENAMRRNSTHVPWRTLCFVPAGLLGSLVASAVGCGSAQEPGNTVSYGGAAGRRPRAGVGPGAGATGGSAGSSSGGTASDLDGSRRRR